MPSAAAGRVQLCVPAAVTRVSHLAISDTYVPAGAVAGERSGERARARAAGEAMGKHVIDAVDGPGFLVNRCNRPWALEALKLLAERAAPLEEIDRICRLGGASGWARSS